MEFAGKEVDNILPQDGRINAFRNLKMPETKSDLRSYFGMLASLQAGTPSISLNIPLLRKACSKNRKVEWNQEMRAEYEEAN